MKITINKLFALLFLVNIANVFSQTCTVPTSERNALIALYNATNGPNWDNNTNWNTTADVCDWYGVTVTNGVVTALNLVEIQLSGSIPAEMGNLTNLTHLNLEFNSIGIITEIGNLTSLTHLNLEGNSIGSIPTGIGNLTNLTQLNLGYNQITGSIPAEIGNLTNLTQLNLVFNQITGSIPSEIGNLINLTQLNLGHNQITGSIPTGIGNLTNLNGLNLYENKLTGSIPTGIGNLINLTSLRLQSNQITGSIPSEIGNLTNLNSLDLSGNKLTGSIPTGIGMLASSYLDYFSFNNNAFVFSDFENEHATYTANIPTYYYSPQAKVDIVEIPFAIEGTSYTFTTSLNSPNNSYQWYKDGIAISGATSKDYTINSVSLTDAGVYYVVATNSIVTGLTLQRNNVTLTVTPYTCSVPQSERNALIALYNATNGPNWTNKTNWNTAADVCDWYGVTVTDGKVTGLNLFFNQLAGTIPPEIGNLVNLTTLNLIDNYLSGGIPSELSGLSNLTNLGLRANELTGSIPSGFGNLLSLTNLDLQSNQLSGAIPDLTGLASLSVFNFQDNKFIFSNFVNEHNTYTTNLTTYNYSPQAKVDQEETINLTEGNSYTLTTSLSSPNNSYQWYKDGVPISGATSKNYTLNPVSLTDAGVYYVVATNSIVTGLTLQRNDNTLTVTPDTCGVPQSERDALMALYNATNGPNWTNTLANNQPWDINTPVCDWYGVEVSNDRVWYVSLYNNNLNGTIPASLGNLTNLITLNLPLNQLTGSIPAELGNLINLSSLSLNSNQLSGSIPAELGNLVNLNGLYLYSNQLTGSIPAELGNLINLSSIALFSNQLTGSIPTELGSLTNLNNLAFHSNQLTGSIPASLGSLINLTNLYLYSNQLTGSIPTELGNLFNLSDLRLHSNQLTGSIPTELGNLSNLRALYLQSNQLTGSIPASLGNLLYLNNLYLSSNQLTGSIPASLGNLADLNALYLNSNQLIGNLPDFRGLDNLAALLFQNNAFIFSNFQNEHSTYSSNLSTYAYSPQAKVDTIETPTVIEGSSYTFTTSLSSPNNSYQWYKDGAAISGATSKNYTLNPVSLTDAGVYYVVATNSIVTGLTLQRNDVTLTVTPDTCGVPQSERDALIALYDATNGPDWTNTLANNQAWDINIPVCNWYGVTVENGTVTFLNLYTNQLSGSIPPDIGNLTNLIQLNLHTNQLSGTIPSEVGNLSSLTILELSSNQLTGSIPNSIGQLSNLEGIALSQNQLFGTISVFSQLSNLKSIGINDNQFNGTIPSSFTLLNSLYALEIHNNAFVFENFENEHINYTNSLYYYDYYPQAKVDQEETINLTEGNSITLTSNQLSSPNNSYQWYKDGIAITNATSKDYVIANATFSDAGVYHFTATNSIVTGLTLQRNDITLTVNACVIPQSERDILMALYDATNGSNWTNTQANNQPWDINIPVCDWYGVTVQNGSVRGLFLQNNNLSGTLPIELNTLPNLTSLILNNNSLYGFIPIGYDALEVLKWFHFDNNAFVFKDFQDWHSDYYSLLDEDDGYQYSPQAKIDQEETITLTTSDSYTLTNSLSNGNNLYQWQISTDGGLTFTNINNATSHDYIINGSSVTEGLYRVKVNNDMVGGLTLYRHNYTVIVGAANTFCTSEWSESPTINSLTPSGPNIEWYTTETGGTPLNDVDKLGDHPISTYWWDDITDGNSARTAATITIDENSPEGNEVQFFSLGANATINDLVASGTNVQWFNSAFSDTPLNGETPLVDDTIYYAEDVGTTTCRLGVEVYLETEAPTGNTLQMVCHNSTIANLSITPQSGARVEWYDSETGTNTLETTTPLVEGTTYYAAQVDSFGYESIERLGINITFFDTQPPMVPSNVQKFYSNEPATVAHLLVKGNNVQWYSQSTEGVLLGASTPLVDGDNYYAQHTDGTCISGRVAVTVDILDEPLPTIISCEKFKPQLGGHYVISGWVKEQVASATPSEIKPFSDVATHFIDLINHLKDRLLSENPSLHDIPSVYIPNSDTEVLNFDPIVPFVVGLPAGETKLTVYNFERILDNYGGNNKGRIIGFKFSLSNQENAPVFQYQTPFAEVYNCDSCYDKQLLNNVNYPLYSINSETLNFTGATVSNGILTVSQSFNFTNPDPITVPNITGATLFSESITYYDYIEDSYYQSPTYEHAKIELTYVDENGDILTDTNGSIIQSIFSPQGAIIDGWQRIMGEFKIPTNAKLLNLNLKSGSSDINAYFDDMRIHPFDSNMKTFVYHPETQRLTSELDENNYATFYEYDLEGGLVRVKKETEKGIYTIQETRSGNVKATN